MICFPTKSCALEVTTCLVFCTQEVEDLEVVGKRPGTGVAPAETTAAESRVSTCREVMQIADNYESLSFAQQPIIISATGSPAQHKAEGDKA